MKLVFAALLLFTAPLLTIAYNPLIVDPPEPYTIIPIQGDPYVEHHYLGSLNGSPEMYELTTDVSITLKVSVWQRASRKAVPFGLMLVRQNNDDGGVTEIARSMKPLSEWEKFRDSTLGMTFLKSKVIEKEITPGTYRVEVSTPDNRGNYLLLIGDEPVSRGYFGTLRDVHVIQDHFGYTVLHLFFSRYLYIPLGILGLLYAIYGFPRHRTQWRTWWSQFLNFLSSRFRS